MLYIFIRKSFNIFRQRLKEQIARDRAEKASQVNLRIEDLDPGLSVVSDWSEKTILNIILFQSSSAKATSQVTTPAGPPSAQTSSQSPLKEYTTCRLQVWMDM